MLPSLSYHCLIIIIPLVTHHSDVSIPSTSIIPAKTNTKKDKRKAVHSHPSTHPTCEPNRKPGFVYASLYGVHTPPPYGSFMFRYFAFASSSLFQTVISKMSRLLIKHVVIRYLSGRVSSAFICCRVMVIWVLVSDNGPRE